MIHLNVDTGEKNMLSTIYFLCSETLQRGIHSFNSARKNEWHIHRNHGPTARHSSSDSRERRASCITTFILILTRSHSWNIPGRGNGAQCWWIQSHLSEKEVNITTCSTSSTQNRPFSRSISNMLKNLLLVSVCLITTTAAIVVPLLLTGLLRPGGVTGNSFSYKVL